MLFFGKIYEKVNRSRKIRRTRRKGDAQEEEEEEEDEEMKFVERRRIRVGPTL